MRREEVGDRIVTGQTYRMHLESMVKRDGYRVRESVAYELYEVVDFVTHFPSYQEHVLYRLLEGPQAGRMFTCSLFDFALKFHMEKREPPEEEVPEGDVRRPKG